MIYLYKIFIRGIYLVTEYRRKIKISAFILGIVEVLGSVIAGFIILSSDEDLIVTGLLVLVVGSFLSLLGAFLVYGFGELIDIAAEMEVHLRQQNTLLSRHSVSSDTKKSEPQECTRKEVLLDIPKQCENCGSTISSYPCEQCGFVEKTRIPVPIEKSNGKIKCPNCGQEQLDNRTVCFRCEQKFINGKTPFWCAKCGKDGPFEVCPVCGSQERIYNNG